MSTERKGAEFFVGLFLLIGLGIIAAMVLIFGRFSQGMQKFYTLRVVFPNASGVVKGCDVLISGARVGGVAQAPTLIGDNYEVAVELHINEAFQIPRTSSFQIRSNGMLGDSYIDIIPPRKYSAADFAVPGEIIAGRKVSGFDELTSKGSELVDKLNTEILAKLGENLDEIKLATTNLNTRLLSDKNLANVEETFANLKEVTRDFSKTSKDLDIVMAKAGEAIDSVKLTMKTADSSAAELKLALAELRGMADTATRTIDSTKVLINKASNGDGTFGALVSDKQMAQDLKALIANMRRSGLLFYKDRPPPAPATPAPATPVPKKRR
ncbi:MAG: phospholipid/cholesterol/gamma-HCH transport system substrate-binding protein [Chthoniobacter sp.]|jgi:ABC-type transporter Mla subunit MlaD|nr:phospholipid/cholesterol/gamma-HCH transport system substrate-binding protein [Chthoniobacter sp.]